MRSGIILLLVLLLLPLATAAPIITGTSGELSNTNRITITGNNFGVGPDTAQTAFLGGANGWANRQPTGTHLKDMTPFSTGQQSEWTYIYSGYGEDDLVSAENNRIPGKNQLLLQTGGLTPSVMYDSTFGLSTDNPQQTFFISFWVRQHIQDINFETVNCLPGYTDPRENETIFPQNKFFSLASKARLGEPGVVVPNNYGSNRNQWVIGSGRVHEVNGEVVRREGFGGEWYTHHGDPDFSYDSPTNSYNICGVNKQVGPVAAPYLYATQLTGVGGYNGQSCQPYDWGWHASGGPATDALQKALDFDEWVKLQIWMKAGEFDTYDDKLIFQILKENGLHERTINVENGNYFTQIWGDNGEFTHPALFYFYGYFAQDYSAYENISGVITKICQGESTGWLKTYVDDFYIQPGSWAHIELGDAPVYEDTTILEIQKPVTWNSNQIELELNTGFFNPGDTAYLFVIDDNGDASPGYQITIQDYTQGAVCWDNQQNGDETGVDCGGSCPNACPSCTDGLQNQDELGVDCGGSCPNQCPLEGDIIVLQNDGVTYSGQNDACISWTSYDNRDNTTFDYCGIRYNQYIPFRMLVNFDLSSLEAGRTIQSATLELTEISAGDWAANSNITISPLLKDWSSTGVTWLCTNDENHNRCVDSEDISWETPGAKGALDTGSVLQKVYVPYSQTVSIDVTSIVSEWYDGVTPNHGFILDQVDNPRTVNFGYDTYSDISKRPKLTIIFEPNTITEPTITGVSGTLNDGAIASLSGALLGTHTNQIEWMGGINGPIETMPVGSQLRRVWAGFSNDPVWDSYPGWTTGTSSDESSPSLITDGLAHSGSHSMSNDCVDNWMCSVEYRLELDPAMPDSASEIFTSSWVYLDPTSAEGLWKLLHIQQYPGNEPGHIGYEASYNNLDGWWNEVILFYPMDETLHSVGCEFPCAAPLTCGSCGFPQPINNQNEADQWYWGAVDSDGPRTQPLEPAFGQWFRLDWYIKASSDFDTWDGYSLFRLTNPSTGMSVTHKLDGIATHAADPLYTGSTPFATPWDNVYKIVRWKNQVSNGASGYVYHDDYYVQVGTPARVEICNNIDYYAASHCEIQKPNLWQSDSIQFEVNFGSFNSGEQVYLFVITDDLNITSAYPVTLGTGSPGCSYVGFDIIGECGFVGFDDFLIVVENFRTTNSRYDFNDDGVVNVLDLVLHLLNWG